jgi:hypothetical protein
MAAADAVAGQHPDGAPVHLDGQRNEGHRLGWQALARHGAEQEGRLGVHVLHDGRLAGAQHPAGDPLAGTVTAPRHFVARQAVGMADAAGRRIGARRRGLVLGQHHAAAVQAQQLAHQVQHLAQHGAAGRRGPGRTVHLTHLAHLTA